MCLTMWDWVSARSMTPANPMPMTAMTISVVMNADPLRCVALVVFMILLLAAFAGVARKDFRRCFGRDPVRSPERPDILVDCQVHLAAFGERATIHCQLENPIIVSLGKCAADIANPGYAIPFHGKILQFGHILTLGARVERDLSLCETLVGQAGQRAGIG